MEHCTFCKLPHTASDIQFGCGKYFWWKFDAHPVTPGHTIVVPTRHMENFSEFNNDEKQAFWRTIPAAIAWIENRIPNIREDYQRLREERISENSVKFIDEILSSVCFSLIRLGDTIDGYNHGCNIGGPAGQTVPHFHWHIIPRYEGDVEDPRGGIRHVIPSKGNYNIPRH